MRIFSVIFKFMLHLAPSILLFAITKGNLLQNIIYQATETGSTCNKIWLWYACKLKCFFLKVNETLTSSVFYCVQVVQAQKILKAL
jgi:hypothetical protein